MKLFQLLCLWMSYTVTIYMKPSEYSFHMLPFVRLLGFL